MKCIKNLIYLAGAIAVTIGCATTVTLTSSPPGADLYFQGKKLGSTPFVLSHESTKPDPSGGYLIRLEKSGYYAVWVWVPSGVTKIETNINLQPFAIEAGKTSRLPQTEIDALSASLLHLQTDLILNDTIDNALLDKVTAEHPSLGAAYYLKALKQLRDGNKPEAKASLAKALSISTNESEYAAMLREIDETNNP